MRKDAAWSFKFPQGFDNGIRLKNLLLPEFPKNLIKDPRLFSKTVPNLNYTTHRIQICGALLNRHYKLGNQVIWDNGIIGCLTTKQADYIYDSKHKVIRNLTALEHLRLMGFSDDDYFKCKAAGVSDNEIIKQAGNSIVVNVLMAIFGELLKVDWRKAVYGFTKENNYAELPLFKGTYEKKPNIQYGLHQGNADYDKTEPKG